MSLRLGRRELTSRPRLIAIDVDHTLIRSDRSLATATVDAVDEARGAGIVVVLASSRPPGGLWSYLEPLGLVHPETFVGFQGALVGSFNASGSLAVHATSPLEVRDAVAAAYTARSLGLVTNWYTAEGWYVDALTAPVQREAAIVGMNPQTVTDMASLPAPLKLLFIADRPSQIGGLVGLLPASVTAEISNPSYLEVTAAGVDKATGVRVAASRYGIEMEDVVAVGDGRNDLGLFRRVRGSIAPANADPTVLDEADYVTASNDDDGVAMALQWLTHLPAQ